MKINVNEVRRQLNNENVQVKSAMSSVSDITPAITEYTGTPLLKGMTYESFCEMFDSVTNPLIKAILCMLEAKYEGNTTYLRVLDANLSGMGKVDDSNLRNSVEYVDKKIQDLRSNAVIGTISEPYIYVLEKFMASTKTKLEKIDAFLAQTNGCYDEFNTRNSLALQGINCARAISFNTSTGQMSQIDSAGYEWAKKVSEYYDNKTYEIMQAQYGDYLKDNKSDIVKIKQVVEYERFHVNDIAKVNEFLEGLETKDIIGIKAVAYTAPVLYRDLWIKYLDKYTVEVNADEGAYFTSLEDKIVVNPEAYRSENYHTFFHECGHAIDNYAGEDIRSKEYFSDSYVDEDGTSIDQAIVGDIKSFVGVQVATIFAAGGYGNMSASERNTATENIINSIMSGGETELTATEEKIATEVKTNFSRNAWGRRNSLVSDVYSGATDFEMLGDYSHKNNVDSKGTYWLYNDGTQRRKPSVEYVAEYYGYAMTNNIGGMNSVENYLGESKEIVEGMFEEIANLK